MASTAHERSLDPLGHLESRTWEPNRNAVGRRARTGGVYQTFIPEQITKRTFTLGDDAVSAVVSASNALARLDDSTPKLASLNALAANLLRSESAASSRIEGLAISHRRLARAAYRGSDQTGGDSRAAAVLGNVAAMRKAIDFGATVDSFRVSHIEEIHRTLLRFTADRKIAGVIRAEQNWIGGSDHNPIGATFVPPPPEFLPALLDDFCRFVERDDLAPVAQAAIAHAQFENLHPFADGNGRVGRALIYTVLRRRGEALRFIPPISLVLATEQRNYIAGFGAYSGGDVGSWCETFASATERAAQCADEVAAKIEVKQIDWLERLGSPRRDAAVRQIVSALPEQPVIDVAAGQKLTGKSHVAVQSALAQLEESGVLRKLNERRWGRVWECGELFDLVEDFEAALSG